MTGIQPNSHDANSAPAAFEAGQEEVPAVNPERGGSPSHAAPSLILEYYGAFVLDAGDRIRVVLCGPSKRGLKMALYNSGWTFPSEFTCERPRSAAAIASAREILGRFYGDPVQ